MLKAEDWTVAVFKCTKEIWTKVLIELSDTVTNFEEALSFHFTIRDYTNGKLWVSFRVFRNKKDAASIERKIQKKLTELSGNRNFEAPPKTPQFKKYIKFAPFDDPEKVEKHWGNAENWKKFCRFLHRLSLLVIDMAKQKQFEGNKRIEVGHLLLNMLGIREGGYVRGALYDNLGKENQQRFYPY